MSRARANSYRLILRAHQSDVPENVRMRRLLKYALRECEFVCTSITDAKAPRQGVEREHVV